MTNRRVRSIIAQTRGLRNAVGWTVVGILLFVLGSALSFQVVIEPLLSSLNAMSRRIFAMVVPPDQLGLATHFLGGAFLVLGLLFLIVGIRQFFLHLIRTLNPALGEARV